MFKHCGPSKFSPPTQATSGEIYAGRMSPEMNGEGVENMIKLWKSGELHTMMKKKKTRR